MEHGQDQGEGALAFSVDHALCSSALTQPFALYDGSDKEVVIKSFKELPIGVCYHTCNRSSLTRISDSQLLLKNGEQEATIELQEEDEDESKPYTIPGILVIHDQKPILLDPDGFSAEKMVEKLSGQKLFEGIPFYKELEEKTQSKPRGFWKRTGPVPVQHNEAGKILFSLHELPIGEAYLFHCGEPQPTTAAITHLEPDVYLINGCRYSSAKIEEEIEDRSGVIEMAYPHLLLKPSPMRQHPNERFDVSGENGPTAHSESDSDSDEDEQDAESQDQSPNRPSLCVTQVDGDAHTEAVPVPRYTSKRMHKFEETLQASMEQRTEERKRRLQAMMQKYDNIPSLVTEVFPDGSLPSSLAVTPSPSPSLTPLSSPPTSPRAHPSTDETIHR